MSRPASGTISLSNITNSTFYVISSVSLGDITTEVLAGNSAAGQQVSLGDYYGYASQSFTTGTNAILQAVPGVGTSSFGQGWGVALNSNGTTMAVGDPNQGKVFVWTRSGTTWSTQTAISIGAGAGCGVALSADGNTLAITGGNPTYPATYSSYVYTRSGSTWSSQATLDTYTTGTNNFTMIGYSVATSADGNTVAVGVQATGANNNGSVYVYTRSGSTWSTMSTINGSASGGRFGSSVSLTPDGQLLAIGAVGAVASVAAYVYRRQTSSWSNLTPAGIVVSPANSPGNAVSITADGKILFIGDSGQGAVFGTQTNNNWSSWTFPVFFVVGTYGFTSMAASPDGTQVISGDWSIPRVSLLNYTGSGFTIQSTRTYDSLAGQSCAWSTDGKYIAVGAPGGSGGKVYILT